MDVASIDTKIRSAWTRGDHARVDELLDQRLALRVPAPYYAPCHGPECTRAAVYIPVVLDGQRITLVRCAICDTRRCQHCKTQVADAAAPRCPTCQRSLFAELPGADV